MALNLRNIISMEDGEYEPADVVEAEVAVDEVEANEAEEEITTDVEVITDYTEELDETQEEVEELEDSQEVLEEALEDPNYEGMEEVAAEMIGMRLRSLAKRRGFDVSRVEGVFSKESFNMNTRNRRRKTEIALEGIKDAIIAMWERIKAAVKAVWQAIKDFWKKHISTLGRLLKALEKMKRKVRDTKGNPDASKKPKPSSSLQRAFFSKNDSAINTTLISSTLKLHDEATEFGVNVIKTVAEGSHLVKEGVNKVVKISIKNGVNFKKNEDLENEARAKGITDDNMPDFSRAKNRNQKTVSRRINTTGTYGSSELGDMSVVTDIYKKLFGTIESGVVGKEDAPLVNGWFPVVDMDGIEDEVPKVEFKWDQRDIKPDDKRELEVGGISDMGKVLDSAITLIKKTQNLGENFNKASNDYDKAMNDINRDINSTMNDTDDSDIRHALSTYMRLMNDFSKLIPKINTKVVGLNATLAKNIISYCGTSISNYKTN